MAPGCCAWAAIGAASPLGTRAASSSPRQLALRTFPLPMFPSWRRGRLGRLSVPDLVSRLPT